LIEVNLQQYHCIQSFNNVDRKSVFDFRENLGQVFPVSARQYNFFDAVANSGEMKFHFMTAA